MTVESGPSGGQKIRLTEEGKKWVEDYYASLPPDKAKVLRESLEREVGRLMDMTPLERFQEAYMTAAGRGRRSATTEGQPSADNFLSQAKQRISGIFKR